MKKRMANGSDPYKIKLVHVRHPPVYLKDEADKYIDELKTENERLKDLYKTDHHNIQYLCRMYGCDNVEAFHGEIKNLQTKLIATERALWLARAERAKTEYQHWILIWHCANTNQYFFINKTRYKHTSKVDRMRYPLEWRDIWSEVEQRCSKKAEEYE